MIKLGICMIVLLLSGCSINNTNEIINIEKELDINYRNILNFSKTGEYIHNIVLSPDKKTIIHTEYITDKGLKKEIVFKNGKKFYECNDVKSFYTSSVGIDTVSFKFSKDSQSLAFICSNGTNHQVILNGNNIGEYQEIKSYLFDNENNFIFGGKNNDRAFINIGLSEKELDYEYLHNIVVSSKNELAYNVVKDNKRYLIKGDQLLQNYDYNEYPIYSDDGNSFSYKVWNINDRKAYIVKDNQISSKSYPKIWESRYGSDNKLYTFVENENFEQCLLIDFNIKECFDSIFVGSLKFSSDKSSYIYGGENIKSDMYGGNMKDNGINMFIIKDGYKSQYFKTIGLYNIEISNNGESYGFWSLDKEGGNNGIYKDGIFLNDENYYFTDNLVYGNGEDFSYVGFKKVGTFDGIEKTHKYIITNKNTYGPFESYHHLEYGNNGKIYFIVTNKDGKIEYNQGE